MRLLLLICLIIGVIFTNCSTETESMTQATSQTENQEEVFPIAEVAVIENAAEEKADSIIEIKRPQEASTPKPQPILSFDSKVFNYGTIAQGDKVSKTFYFTNKGNADLVIKNAVASCGCTTPGFTFIPIKPGETGTISVTFNSIGKMGTQRPHVTVTSNAYPRTQTLYLEGFVTDQIAKKEVKKPFIEEGIEINLEESTAKGAEVKSDLETKLETKVEIKSKSEAGVKVEVKNVKTDTTATENN